MRQAFRCLPITAESLDGFRYPENQELVAECVKHFESNSAAPESLDGFRYPANQELVAECVKHFESNAAAPESLDGFRYPENQELVAECVKHFESNSAAPESLDGFRYLRTRNGDCVEFPTPQSPGLVNSQPRLLFTDLSFQRASPIDFFEGFEHRCNVHSDRPALLFAVIEISSQALDVAVENHPDQLSAAVDDR